MLERLETLEENIAWLKRMQREFTTDQIAQNKFDEWALRYGLFESIQIVIDLACHLSAKYNLGIAKTYADCIENLVTFDYIDSKLAKKLIAATGLRNMLVHEYVRVDVKKLFGFLSLTDDFSRFMEAIRPRL